jgi:hypothetical protein
MRSAAKNVLVFTGLGELRPFFADPAAALSRVPLSRLEELYQFPEGVGTSILPPLRQSTVLYF